MQAPKAKKIKKELTIHKDTRIDNFFWLNQKDHPDVLEYLEQENEYCDEMMKDTLNLQEELFQEMKARYKEEDESLPYFFNKYWYVVKYKKKNEYPFFYRKHLHIEANEDLILDANQLANGNDYLDVTGICVSPNNKLMTYATDLSGDRIYTIFIKNLETGEIHEEKIPNTTGKTVWANDNLHFFYVINDKNFRSYKVYRHKVGTNYKEDVLIFHEKDSAFDVGIYKTKSLKYIFIASSSNTSDEHHFIEADDIFSDWKVVQPRENNLEYAIEHYKDDFYIITNDNGASNFKIIKTPVNLPQKQNWKELISHREDTLLEGFEIFENYLVLEERKNGLTQICIIDNKTNENHYLPFSEPVYTSYIGLNLEFDTNLLYYGYTSLSQPNSQMVYDMEKRSSKILKQEIVNDPSFSSENYISERIWAPARDGKKIPISVVYNKKTKIDKNTPLLLYGYGSYGHSIDVGFSKVRLSILDRGFIYAIAHVRGGEELGRHWYEDGKMMNKKNSFYDFIDAAKHLINKEYTSSENLYAMGGSAGGLLLGTAINYEPDLFKGVIMQVPFVDVVTTMLDEEIPLTTGEYDEWGNPNEKEYYHYMKSYSPYDNIEPKKYPNILVTSGYHDSQVQYWEPAKWVAKMRDLKTDNNFLLFKIDMKSGHAGTSGRFESLKEDALEYAFLLKLSPEHKTLVS